MILIFSNAAHESTTDNVIDWLIRYKASFIRVNSEDLVQKSKVISIEPGNNLIKISGQEIPLDNINVVWYRRWYNYHDIPVRPVNKHERQLLREMFSEADTIINFFGFALANKKWLNSPITNQLHNKLNVLYQALLLDIKTPDSLVTNKTNELLDFFNKHEGKIITKPLSDPYPFFDEKEDNYKAYVEPITKSFIKKLPPEFFLSLFQSKVEAKCEIRVFYLDGRFYATSIWNNTNTDIKLGVRRDSRVRMNTYKLPDELEDKLRTLMNRLNLNSGSIDIIQALNDEYVFLEVNPIGQFSGYGAPNNYYLEKKVAEWLINNNHN